MSKVFITGANGFLGRRVVAAALERGDDVVAFDLEWHNGNGAEPSDRVNRVSGDVRDRDVIAKAAKGCDAVFHLASVVHVRRSHEDALHAVNVGGTESALWACQQLGIRRFVYVSSASVVYAGRDILDGDEEMPYPARDMAPYAATKRKAEEIVLAADGQGGVRTCSLRPHLIFGPGDTRMLPTVLERARRGLPFLIGDPAKLSDFTYVDNVADAVLLADDSLGSDARAGGRAYFITNGEPRPYWDVLGQILRRVGVSLPSRVLPHPIAYAAAWLNEKTLERAGLGTGSFTPFSVTYLSTHHYFSCARAARELGYQPRVSMDDGIERTARALMSAS